MRNIHVTRNNVICGDKDPIMNKVIPKFVGQQYIMINTNQVFFAKGTTHNDWIEASGSVDIDLSGLATKEEIDVIKEENDVIKEDLSKTENTKYSTENGVKEFSCKDGYVDNVTIEGETLINLATPKSFRTTTSATTYFIWDIKCQDMTLNKTVTVFNFSDKVLRLDVRTGNSSSSTFVRAERVNANSSKVLSLSETEFIQNFNGALTDGWSESDELNLKVSCVILEGDHTDKPISYFEGLKSVGQDDNINIITYKNSNNILDEVTFTENTVVSWETGEPYALNGYKCSDYIEVEPNTLYTFIKGNLNVAFYNRNKDFIRKELPNNVGDDNYFIHISPSNAKYMRVTVFSTHDAIVTKTESEKKQISTTLRSLPNGVKDTIEKRGNRYVKVQRLTEFSYSGEDFQWLGSTGGGTTVQVNIPVSNCKDAYVLSNLASYNGGIPTTEPNTETVFYSAVDNVVCIRLSSTKFTTDKDQVKQYLLENNFKAVLELATPIKIELPNFNPQTYEDNTILLLDTGVIQAECEFEVTNSKGSEIEVLKDKVSSIDNEINYKSDIGHYHSLDENMNVLYKGSLNTASGDIPLSDSIYNYKAIIVNIGNVSGGRNTSMIIYPFNLGYRQEGHGKIRTNEEMYTTFFNGATPYKYYFRPSSEKNKLYFEIRDVDNAAVASNPNTSLFVIRYIMGVK